MFFLSTITTTTTTSNYIDQSVDETDSEKRDRLIVDGERTGVY